MKKKINLKLIESFLDSDFLILDSELSKNHHYNKIKIITKTNVVIALNPLLLLSSLKQLIRVFQFLKNHKSNFNAKRSKRQQQPFIQIYLKNILHKEIFELFFKKYICNNLLKINNNFLSEMKNPGIINSALLINYSISKQPNLLKNLFEKKFFILNSINPTLEFSDNFYKIFNDIESLKKFIYVMSLIEQIYLTKYALKSKI